MCVGLIPVTHCPDFHPWIFDYRGYRYRSPEALFHALQAVFLRKHGHLGRIAQMRKFATLLKSELALLAAAPSDLRTD